MDFDPPEGGKPAASSRDGSHYGELLQLSCATRVLFGFGAVKLLGEAAALGLRRPLVVTDSSLLGSVRAVRDPGDRPARWELMMAALEGGLAFQKGLGAAHALAHPLGALGVHHGTVNAILLPHVLDRR